MVSIIFLWATFASTFIFAKKVLLYTTPMFLLGVRMITAGGILLLYQALTNKKQSLKIKRKDWGMFFFVTLFHIYIALMLEFWSFQYLSPLKTTIIYSAAPFITAVLAYFLLKKQLCVTKLAGMGIGFFGLIPILSLQTEGEQILRWNYTIPLPEIALLLGVVSASYAWFLIKRLMKKGYSLTLINGVAMFLGGVLSMATSVFFCDFSQPVTQLFPFLGWLVALIVAGNFITYNLYAWLLKKYSMTFLAFTGFLSPCFAILFDWLFLGGEITWHSFGSLTLITLGLYVFYREELRDLVPSGQAS